MQPVENFRDMKCCDKDEPIDETQEA